MSCPLALFEARRSRHMASLMATLFKRFAKLFLLLPRSSPFDMQQIGITHVKLERHQEEMPLLARISASLQDATIFITIEREKHWPFLISNRSSTPVTFYQEVWKEKH